MRKSLVFILLLTFLLEAQVPKFEDKGVINANSTPIKLMMACPWVGDWDGDGKKDLMFGMFSGGKVCLYKNSGTNTAPVFTSSSYLKGGNTDIALSNE